MIFLNLVEELNRLNTSQREVVFNLTDNLLVMAPAGTGKTRVISLRVAQFINQGILPKQILCLTFTNKACHELQERLYQLIKNDAKEVVVKTFHSFCYQLLKEEAKYFGKISRDFSVMDEEDGKFLVTELTKGYDILSHQGYQYLQELKLFCLEMPTDKRDDLTFMVEAFHQSEKAQKLYYSFKRTNEGAATLAFLTQNGASLYEAYQRHLFENRLVDFNDLIVYASELLEDESVLSRWRDRFQVIMVDEVQDTSLYEYQLIERLAVQKYFSVFGDFNQTIYEWRDSKPELILSKIMTTFNPKQLELSLNYRSPKRLVEMSANYLENGKKARLINAKLSPKLIEAASEEVGGRPVFYEGQTKQDEMNFIIDHLKYHRLQDLANTVILTRTNNQNIEVSNFLRQAGIPCYLIEDLSLFRRKVIKDLLGFIKFELNPFDQLSLERLLPFICPEVSTELLVGQKYRERYESYGMRLIDLFNPLSYEYKEPYGLLKKYCENGRIVIFDVESTGLDVTRDEVIQIAAIELVNGKYTKSFERFIKPTKSVGDSVFVHGFDDEYLKEYGQDATAVFKEFQKFIQGALLVGHNVQYDLKIVQSQMNRLGLAFDDSVPYYDTLDIVRRVYPHLPNHKLDTVSAYVGVEHEPTHNAMDDILATKDVLIKSMVPLMKYHDNRKRVISFYEPMLREALKALGTTSKNLKLKSPHLVMKDLIEMYQDKHEFHKQSFDELVAYLEVTSSRLRSENPNQSNLEIWTQLINLMALTSSELDRAMKEENKLAIITVHQSKGLEFDHVIIPFMNKGMFPLEFDGINPEEECRLFYVAMTRAKQSLLLTRHLKDKSSSRKVKERSNFISFLYS